MYLTFPITKKEDIWEAFLGFGLNIPFGCALIHLLLTQKDAGFK